MKKMTEDSLSSMLVSRDMGWWFLKLFCRAKKVYCRECRYRTNTSIFDKDDLHKCTYIPGPIEREVDCSTDSGYKFIEDEDGKFNPVYGGWCGVINREGRCPWFEAKEEKKPNKVTKPIRKTTIQKGIVVGIVVTLVILIMISGNMCNAASMNTTVFPEESINVSTFEEEMVAEAIQPSVTLTDIVAEIIREKMIPDRSLNGYITEDESYRAANEILYCMDIHEMQDEDLPYILSLFYCESKFDPRARYIYNCSSCASGFGQIMGMHAWKFNECEGAHSWSNCDAWKNVEYNIYIAFSIMSYGRYAHNVVDRRWRNIYQYNYNTNPDTGWIGVRYAGMFRNILETKSEELEV